MLHGGRDFFFCILHTYSSMYTHCFLHRVQMNTALAYIINHRCPKMDIIPRFLLKTGFCKSRLSWHLSITKCECLYNVCLKQISNLLHVWGLHDIKTLRFELVWVNEQSTAPSEQASRVTTWCLHPSCPVNYLHVSRVASYIPRDNWH